MIINRTPFRISFFGGGTDYPAWYEKNGGAVLSTTIDKYCYISCRYLPPFFDHRSRVVWSKIESVKHVDEIEHPAVREILKFIGIADGVEIHHDADLPARSGLGSSSSFVVGLLHALHALQGRLVTKRQLALDAIHVEQERLKENVGCQDQAAAAFGGFNKVEFGGPQKIAVHPVTLNPEKLNLFQDHLMMFFTGFSRNASEIAKEQIANTDRNHRELDTMQQMVDQAMEILNRPDRNVDDFGRLLDESWQMKRRLASNITNQTIDEIYNVAREAGAIGGKLLGAGGGGFILLFVKPEHHARVKGRLKHLLYVPFRFENIGSQIIYYGQTSTV